MVSGDNGAGKSSLFYLLTKLYLPLTGAITLGGRDLRQIDTYELRQLVAYVPQQCSFFYGTIRQNLLLANPLATDADIEFSLKYSDLYQEIMALSEGLHTRLGDGYETKFPASFLQRLSLACAFIKKPRILLLDDPMNALSSSRESVILRSLEKLRGKVTIIMITYRPSHLPLADRIIKIQSGFLVDNSVKSIADDA